VPGRAHHGAHLDGCGWRAGHQGETPEWILGRRPEIQGASRRLRADHESIGYSKWRIEHAYAILPAVAYVSQHLATYVEFPPRQKAGTFGLDQVLEKLQQNDN
jgi:hypothetical protein